MGYEEFERKLREVKADFRESEGRDPSTVGELEDFLRRRRTGRMKSGSGRPTLKSLKGLGF